MFEITRTRLETDISLAVVSFGDELKTGAMSTEQFLDAAVELGFSAVELCDRTVRDPRKVRVDLLDRGLSMPSIALRNDFTGDQRSVDANVDHLRRWLCTAAELGCQTARIWTGWQRRDAVARAQIADALDLVVEHAADTGVSLAVETHGGLSNEPDFLRELCDKYPRELFGVCLDFGNLPADNRKTRIAQLSALTTHVHVKSHEFTPDGVEISIPLGWAISTVADCGFSGQWVIEYEGDPPFDRGIEHTVQTLRDVLGRTQLMSAA